MMEGSSITAPAVKLVGTQYISKLTDGDVLLYGGGADSVTREKSMEWSDNKEGRKDGWMDG